MNKLAEYFNKLFKTINEKLPMLANSKAPMLIIYGIMAMFILLVILFISGWLQDWYHSGVANLFVMISFIQTITGPSVVLFITFMAKGFIDTNQNNIPDEFENKEDK